MLSRLTITARLSAALCCALILSLIVGATGALQLARVHAVSSAAVSEAVQPMEALSRIGRGINQYVSSFGQPTPEHIAERLRWKNETEQTIRTELARTEAPGGSRQEQALYRRLRQSWRDYMAIAPTTGPADAQAALARSASQKLIPSLDAAFDYTNRQAQTAGERIDGNLSWAMVTLAAATLASTVLITAVLLFVRRRICRPLTTITGALTTLADGNLDLQLPGMERDDEIGGMARAVEMFRLNAIALLAAHDAAAAAERQARLLARHDALTGLPNRVLFREHMERALPGLRRGARLAVLSLDLDGFKAVNDTLGHQAGDDLLCQVAARLRDNIRATDLVARLGGDEFAIIQADADQPLEAAALADRLVATLRQPFELNGSRVEIGTSIGVVIAEPSCTSADELMRNADVALYRAKGSGRGTSCFFEAGMNAEIQKRRALETDLRRALAQEQFEIFYQPLMEARSQTITGLEALLRWNHPERGLISPAEFIPVAEETGLIRAIGAWVLTRACTDAITWPDHIHVAVNLSAVQFVHSSLVAEVEHALVTTGLRPGRLELEITESVMLQDRDSTLSILYQLHRLGVCISMDDFGTGYSSLSYLRRFPFDKIKIDQSFVHDLAREKGSLDIIRAVVGLGKALGMEVLAEGVETEEQSGLLQREGCDQLQGFLFSRPAPLHDVQAMIARHSTTRAQPALAFAVGD